MPDKLVDGAAEAYVKSTGKDRLDKRKFEAVGVITAAKLANPKRSDAEAEKIADAAIRKAAKKK